MNTRWLLRMARWAQNPPSEARVRLVFAVLGICLALFLVERYVGWPGFLTLDPGERRWRP